MGFILQLKGSLVTQGLRTPSVKVKTTWQEKKELQSPLHSLILMTLSLSCTA